jgi:hypothetical protein
MIEWLEKATRAQWADLGLPGKPPAELEFFLSSGVQGKHGKVLFHAFRAGDPKPLFIGKIPRDGTARRWALHEHAFLKELEEAAPRLAGRSFPRALLLEETETRLATGQTLLAGVPMDRKLASLGGGESAARSLYEIARRWLEEFWRETGLLEGTAAALWEPYARSGHFFLETWETSPEVRAAVEEMLAAAESESGGSTLCGFGHGDFLATNLIVDGDRCGAVDWEFGQKRALPWFDPVHFCLDFSLRLGMRTGRGRVASLERGFLEDGWLRSLNLDFLGRCFGEGGVPAEALPTALPMVLLFSAHRMARLFSPTYPVTVAWKEMVERCLRPDARESLLEGVGAAGASG